MENKTKLALTGAGVAAVIALGAGGATLANAATETPSTSSSTSTSSTQPSNQAPEGNGNTDPSKPMRTDEQLLTGDVATKVTAAAKAKEPTATIQRVETDSDGVYEAHMVRTDGTQIIVQIDKSYNVTGVQEMGAKTGSK
ncbi:hypothetical protein FHU41_002836 [Psychromicrobium silvestre]|uniref:Peptidase propeptide and YPEB domain n=1 Tax=Psychromicrobium silvestre TaxID=1645614 RepID=A0A7Y9LVZ9_9MICC|nr:hypothetical protein [Psychromicrobium silvestre]NYE96586.1 hypothetical protein [Psychromicrobium silvestre]